MARGKRSQDWNYGGRHWKLSRSKIDLFLQCPRCFYLDNKLGIRRASLPGFSLNSAVDELLKKEFDGYRRMRQPHPLFKQFGLQAIPYSHPELDNWRENFTGVIVRHSPTNLVVSGAIDDVWELPDGSVAVVDYKSTAKEELDMSSKWIQGYFRQLEIYQWLLRQTGLAVSDTAYILYANGILAADNFDGCLRFEMTLHPYQGKTDWIEPTLTKIAMLLTDNSLPECSADCEHCEFFSLQNNLAPAVKLKAPPKRTLFD